ncbi:unnamed protein product [Calypogeia fissa]
MSSALVYSSLKEIKLPDLRYSPMFSRPKDLVAPRIVRYEVTKYVDKSNNVHAVHYYTFNTLLMTLLVIHIYWWILICRMVSKQLHMQGKIPNDVRSDSEED